jgi:hypothetical protein
MKFTTEDRRYLEDRKRLSERVGPREMWSLIDHWPLYVGIANLGRFMAIADLLRATLEVPGHVAEFGSWRGANVMLLAKLLAIHDPHGNKVVHCFDAFEGLQTFVAADGDATRTRGAYKGDYEELLEILRLYQLEDAVAVHKGLIQETLSTFLESDPEITFSLVYCDTDLYEPTALILESLHPRLSKGGLFVFDQWNCAPWPGESRAANEFMRRFGDSYRMRHVAGARQPTLAIEKLTF